MEPQAHAVCSLHPTQPSVGACSRCGRFFCAACRAAAPQPVCLECSQRLELPLGARFQKFELSRTLNAAFSLLKGTWLHALWITLPFGIVGGIFASLVTPELDPKHISETIWPLYGGVMLSSLFAAVVGLIADLAALSLYVGRAEGRSVSTSQAYREAFGRWPRAVGYNLTSYLQVLGYSLLCGVPGLWKAIVLSLTNVVSFLKPVGSAPLKESERLVNPSWWPVFAFVMIGGLMTLGPVAVVNGGMGAAMKIAHRPREIALITGGILSVAARGILQAFLLAAYYGLTAKAEEAPPISPEAVPTP